MEPRFVMERAYSPEPRKALQGGKTIRRVEMGLTAIYTPVRVKPRYWTSQVRNASVIHIATGRGVLVQGTVATRGWIMVEPYCNGRLSWPRALSSPADFPERRLCQPCLISAHTAELGEPPASASGCAALLLVALNPRP